MSSSASRAEGKALPDGCVVADSRGLADPASRRWVMQALLAQTTRFPLLSQETVAHLRRLSSAAATMDSCRLLTVTMTQTSMYIRSCWQQQSINLLFLARKDCCYPSVRIAAPPAVVLLMLLASAGVLAAPSVQAGDADPCSPATSTVERIDCRAKQMEAADQKLQKYLKAAQSHVASDRLNPDKIKEEQVAWERYKEIHCGNIYRYWLGGSIRHDKESICRLKLTKDRTYDIWRAYLTYADSTAAVLPDPDLNPPMPPLQCRFNREKEKVALKLDKEGSFTLMWSDGPRQIYTWVGSPSSTHNLTDALGGRWRHRSRPSGPERQGFTMTNLSNGNQIDCH